MKKSDRRKAGLYLHVPFCNRICPYCNFYSLVPNGNQIDEFVESLMAEAELKAAGAFAGFEYDTVFIGGGTPSLIDAAHLESILTHLRSNFEITDDAEITMECNPSSKDRDSLGRYRDIGVNRISLGIQSFQDRHLETLGRLHDSGEAIQSFHRLRQAGFENASIDILYGLPGQTIAEWEDDLNHAIELDPDHISAYNLIIEPDTPFGRQYTQGKLKLPTDEQQSRMYELLNDRLTDAEYQMYEICNFARPGHQCRHNMKYWRLMPYLGLGPSAVSFDGRRRFKNIVSLKKYSESLEGGSLPPMETENIDRRKAIDEQIMMGLRLTRGLSLQSLRREFGYDLATEKSAELEVLTKTGFIESEGGHLRLTSKALFLADEIILKLL
jgi:oxygen-independent coproporphyrinogen-3 oxidase